MQSLRNVQEALKANFEDAAQVEEEIGKLDQHIPVGQNHEVMNIRTIMGRLSITCLNVHKNLKNYLRSTADRMRMEEVADKERTTKLQEMRKASQVKEDIIDQVKQDLKKEKEKTASIANELATVKKERSNFFARRAGAEDSVQNWGGVGELNEKLDKEKEKVSNLENALKLHKEEILTKNATVLHLEGVVELLKNGKLY